MVGAGWTRVVGLALAVALSGGPAAVAACAAACLPMRTMAHAASVASVTADESLAPPGHEHHHAAALAARVPASGGARVGSSADLHACCPEPHALPATAVAFVRADGHAAPPAALTTPAPWRHAPSSALVSLAAGPHAGGWTGARPPLVLRI